MLPLAGQMDRQIMFVEKAAANIARRWPTLCDYLHSNHSTSDDLPGVVPGHVSRPTEAVTVRNQSGGKDGGPWPPYAQAETAARLVAEALARLDGANAALDRALAGRPGGGAVLPEDDSAPPLRVDELDRLHKAQRRRRLRGER